MNVLHKENIRHILSGQMSLNVTIDGAVVLFEESRT